MYKRDETIRKKISDTLKGKPKTLSHRQAMSQNHAAYKETGAFYWSDEYKEKISKANKGKKHNQHTKELCRQAALKQHYGDIIPNPDPVPIMPNRPDWLKDYL